jgi:hypothetical protein
MKKILILSTLIFLICSGCNRGTSQAGTTSSGATSESDLKATSTVAIASPNIEDLSRTDGTNSKSTDSVDTMAWKIYISDEHKQALAWTTENWSDFNPDHEAFPVFSFSYPAHWIVGNGSPIVFDTNSEGSKIAEMVGIVRLKQNQTCLESFNDDEKPVKIHPLRLGDLSGNKTIWETVLDGDDNNVWHIYRYCLANKQLAFLMSFQALDSDTKSEQTFDKVISTLKFDAPTLSK